MGKETPSSEEKEDIGESVPEVRTMERAMDISEKAYKSEACNKTEGHINI